MTGEGGIRPPSCRRRYRGKSWRLAGQPKLWSVEATAHLRVACVSEQRYGGQFSPALQSGGQCAGTPALQSEGWCARHDSFTQTSQPPRDCERPPRKAGACRWDTGLTWKPRAVRGWITSRRQIACLIAHGLSEPLEEVTRARCPIGQAARRVRERSRRSSAENLRHTGDAARCNVPPLDGELQ